MAVRAFTCSNLVGGTVRVTWTGLLNGDTGSPFHAYDHTYKDVQVFGTFGAGGSVSIEGSLDGGTTWATLNDEDGQAATFAAARIERLQQSTASIRPNVTAGDGTTSMTVVAVLKLAEVLS